MSKTSRLDIPLSFHTNLVASPNTQGSFTGMPISKAAEVNN